MITTCRITAVITLMFLMVVGLPWPARSESYDDLVAIIRDTNPSVRIRGEEKLVQLLKGTILESELGADAATEDTFLFGHFVSPTTLDLAVGISTIPYGGSLVVLSQTNGHYFPVCKVTNIAHIDSIETVRLFAGELDQVVLNLYTGGSGLRHWAKDIYRWDGECFRMIWAGVRVEKYVEMLSGPHREDIGQIVKGDISFGDMREDGTREILTSTVIEKGTLNLDHWEIEDVASRSVTTSIHTWDQSLFYYVAMHGRILPPGVKVSCVEHIVRPAKQRQVELKEGRIIGIDDYPGVMPFGFKGYKAVIGKEHFCEIPKFAVELID